MKKIIITLFVAISTFSFAQDTIVKQVETFVVNKTLENKIQQFFKAYDATIKKEDWSTLMDKMPPEFLEIMSKESLIGQMEKAFNNEAYTTTFNEMTFKDVKSAFLYDKVAYITVNYKSSFTFHFKRKENKSDKDFETYVAFMNETFTRQFKGQTVKRNGADITVEGNKSIIIIDNPALEELKMLEYDKGMHALYEMIFPKPVAARLGKE